uniref:Uncharacterized protein n=1 Tax=Anguilla anguilla TaxID=7936 RepID=A0A0E9SWB2_ANGAN
MANFGHLNLSCRLRVNPLKGRLFFGMFFQNSQCSRTLLLSVTSIDCDISIRMFS